MNFQHRGHCKKHRPKFRSMWISQRISLECSCWIPQLHRVWYSQCFCWLREDKTTDADDEKQRLRWNACIIWKWDRDEWFINQLAQQICMAYARLEREGFWQQYKIPDVLPKRSKDSLRKTPTLWRCAAAPHIEGKPSSVYMETKFISTAGQKPPPPTWLVPWWRTLFWHKMDDLYSCPWWGDCFYFKIINKK